MADQILPIGLLKKFRIISFYFCFAISYAFHSISFLLHASIISIGFEIIDITTWFSCIFFFIILYKAHTQLFSFYHRWAQFICKCHRKAKYIFYGVTNSNQSYWFRKDFFFLAHAILFHYLIHAMHAAISFLLLFPFIFTHLISYLYCRKIKIYIDCFQRI